MGVEGFISWVLNYVIKGSRKTSAQFLGQVLVDFNFIIHQEAQKEFGYGEYKNTNPINPSIEGLLKRLESRTYDILDRYNAEIYYFALDGVPPAAKIIQQRTRRFASDNVVYRDGEIIWDSLWISPYNDFMFAVENMIKGVVKVSASKYSEMRRNFVKLYDGKKEMSDKRTMDYLNELYNNKQFDEIRSLMFEPSEIIDPSLWTAKYKKVELLTHTEPGEGEHKLMQVIKFDKKCLIIGNDADMIILSLSKESGTQGVFIEHEDKRLGKFTMIAKNDIMSKLGEYKITQQNIWDFILITQILGNDFVKATPQGRYVSNAMNHLLNVYKDGYVKDGKTTKYKLAGIDQKGNIVMKDDEFGIFISNALAKEQLFYNKEAVEKLGGIYDVVKEGGKGKWLLFDVLYTDKVTKPYSKTLIIDQSIVNDEMCFDWLIAVRWIMNYYKGNNISKVWYYKHNYAPSLHSLKAYIDAAKMSKTKKNASAIIYDDSTYLTRGQHYVSIVPLREIANLPQRYAQEVYNNLFDMFPNTIKEEKELTKRPYLLMPPIPIKRIKMLSF